MKAEVERVLLVALQKQEALAREKRPPRWRPFSTEMYEEGRAHGPEYKCSTWFGEVPEHERLRLLRGVEALEREGLLVTWRRFGRRLSRVKLTAQGLKVARGLRAQKRAAGKARAAAKQEG
jgi:hypothetical protein